MWERVFVDGPNLKGALAEVEIAAEAIRLGVPVLRPVAEHGRYDLGLEVGGQVLRTQCKWGAWDERRGVINVSLETSSRSCDGYIRRPYLAGELDLLAVYCGGLDRSYLLPAAPLAGARGLRLRVTPPGNAQRACITLAADHEFAGAVAQLAERLNGIQEAGGSSPPSSINDAERPHHTVGANQFRNHFGWYMERAAAGDEILIERHGRAHVRLLPA